MPPMKPASPWYSPACAISDTECQLDRANRPVSRLKPRLQNQKSQGIHRVGATSVAMAPSGAGGTTWAGLTALYRG